MSPDPRLREAFALFDRDGDGELTSSEALLAIRSIGVVVNADEANGIPAVSSHQNTVDCLQRYGTQDCCFFVEMPTYFEEVERHGCHAGSA